MVDWANEIFSITKESENETELELRKQVVEFLDISKDLVNAEKLRNRDEILELRKRLYAQSLLLLNQITYKSLFYKNIILPSQPDVKNSLHTISPYTIGIVKLIVSEFPSNIREGRCQRMVKLNDRSLEFAKFGSDEMGVISTSKYPLTQLQNIKRVAQIVISLYDFQYNLSKDLNNSRLKENLTKDDLKNYTKALLGAQACILNFGKSLVLFIEDPVKNQDTLNRTIQRAEKFIQSVTAGLDTYHSLLVVSEALSTIGIDERQVDDELSR